MNHTPHHDHADDVARVKDPVCGMSVTPGSARGGSAAHDGRDYWFCNPKCRDKFIADPVRYVATPAPGEPRKVPDGTAIERGQARASEPVARPPARKVREPVAPPPAGAIFTCPMHPEIRQPGPGDCPECGMALEPAMPSARTEYVCPMHPEIVRDEPGSCPVCGMALEPRTVTLDEDNPELRAMSRRFWIGAAFTLPLLVLTMAEMFGAPITAYVSARPLTWIQLAVATPVVLWGGWPFFVRGWRSVITRKLNMFTLIAIGIATAYGFSLFATLAPGGLPHAFVGHGGAAAVYFEAAAVITVLVLLGQVLELRARSATSSAIKALLGLAPKTARRLRDDGTDEEVPLDRVQPGDQIGRAHV